MKNIIIATFIAASLGLSGCAAVQQASSLYNNAKAGMTLYSAKKMIDDVKDAKPFFKGFDSVMVEANLMPRDGDPDGEIHKAFVGNMSYLVRENADMAAMPVTMCDEVDRCSGRILVLQFTEEGFNRNLFEKMTMGGALKGTLTYYDQSNSQVIGNKRIEPIKNYRDIMAMINGSIWTSMYVSKDRKVPDDYKDRMNSFEVVDPRYTVVLDNR